MSTNKYLLCCIILKYKNQMIVLSGRPETTRMWIFFGTKCLIALKFLSFGVKCAKGRFFWDLKSGHEFKLFPAKNKPL